MDVGGLNFVVVLFDKAAMSDMLVEFGKEKTVVHLMHKLGSCYWWLVDVEA